MWFHYAFLKRQSSKKFQLLTSQNIASLIPRLADECVFAFDTEIGDGSGQSLTSLHFGIVVDVLLISP